jgi:hypothetical protein
MVALPVEPYTPTRWQLAQGARLRATLQDWTREAGWQLLWRYDTDLEVAAGANWSGSFEQAVRRLISALPPELQIGAELRTGNSPPLLIIDRLAQ